MRNEKPNSKVPRSLRTKLIKKPRGAVCKDKDLRRIGPRFPRIVIRGCNPATTTLCEECALELTFEAGICTIAFVIGAGMATACFGKKKS